MAFRMQHRAALLLEVIVALAIMVLAMGLMGAQMKAGLEMTGRAEEELRAGQLADRMLALLELDLELTEQFLSNDSNVMDGDFGDQYPRHFWRASVEVVPNTEGFGLLTLEILYDHAPDAEPSLERARVIRSVHMLKANPGRIDLAEDFGVDEEQLALLEETMPIEGFDPANFDPQKLVALEPEQLLEVLPIIMQLFPQFASDPNIPSDPAELQNWLMEQLLNGGPGSGGQLPTGVDSGGIGGMEGLLEDLLGGAAVPGGGTDVPGIGGGGGGGSFNTGIRSGDSRGRGARGGGPKPPDIDEIRDRRDKLRQADE